MRKRYIVLFLLGIFLSIANHSIWAKPIVIIGKTIIKKPTTYKNVVLDLTRGYFYVVNNASLQIENCIINGTISPRNIHLINLVTGSLVFKNNKVSVTSVDIPKNPLNPSGYDVISVLQGQVMLVGNKFSINTPYTVGLFVTGQSYTTDFNISENEVKNFHGGFLLKNSQRAYIGHNQFFNVSISSVFIDEGSNSLINNNNILFPGNNNVGDGIDIIDSDHIILNKNYIASGSCYSIIVLRGKDITISHNKIVGGITYAISINSSMGFSDPHNGYLLKIIGDQPRKKFIDNNQNIRVVNNYIAQNRYGLTAANVDGLVAENNIFIQSFSTNASRQFWTNNDVLLQNVKSITWTGNLYKEAFSQQNSECGGKSCHFVEFPLAGGVNL